MVGKGADFASNGHLLIDREGQYESHRAIRLSDLKNGRRKPALTY